MGERASIVGFDNVRVDEDHGLRLTIDHLVESGHRNIASAGGRGGVVGRERAEVYQTAMQDAGLGSHVNVLVFDFDEESAAAIARQLARLPAATRPTAVICCGDLHATAVLASFAQLGVRVPEEILIVGFGDSYVAALSYGRLTSIRQDVDVTARRVSTLSVRSLDGASRMGIRPALPRRSC
jgi:DNA-binding LacI/PurR family transcriptional regulator